MAPKAASNPGRTAPATTATEGHRPVVDPQQVEDQLGCGLSVAGGSGVRSHPKLRTPSPLVPTRAQTKGLPTTTDMRNWTPTPTVETIQAEAEARARTLAHPPAGHESGQECVLLGRAGIRLHSPNSNDATSSQNARMVENGSGLIKFVLYDFRGHHGRGHSPLQRHGAETPNLLSETPQCPEP